MYPEAYIQYLIQFHGYRDFFECHEILEEHWKEKEVRNRDKYWVGLIQVAVGLYHHRRENWRGARKTFQNARSIIQENETSLQQLGLDTSRLIQLIDERLSDLLLHKGYTDMNLPITDTALIEQCRQECEANQVTWLADSDLDDPYIIHRHILRDRTSVTEERLHQKLLREQKKLSRS
ncbi:DUF309 domain-containing protein [Alteribacillus sp. YIM 98480]|uniref:DUF309 domain-containing protein n=1 Tax=Alteribacillus sp. YIM 98480 TaxID=2606599 RepID=UPI00131B1D9A|nr:DUF309 domain-containing protein [Alteribacillus sp. YIM 98480]